jgi:bacterioferritin-associated ferredoxin
MGVYVRYFPIACKCNLVASAVFTAGFQGPDGGAFKVRGNATAMYVCLCHALTTRDITHHAQQCGGSVAGVYKRLGCRPQCGKCVADVRSLIRGCQARSETELSMAGGDD